MTSCDLRPGDAVRVGPFRGVVCLADSNRVVTHLLDVHLRLGHVTDSRGLVSLRVLGHRGDWLDHDDFLPLLTFPVAS